MIPSIHPLEIADLNAASQLLQRVFDRFEGPEYPDEGIETFHRLTAPEALAEQQQQDGIRFTPMEYLL